MTSFSLPPGPKAGISVSNNRGQGPYIIAGVFEESNSIVFTYSYEHLRPAVEPIEEEGVDEPIRQVPPESQEAPEKRNSFWYTRVIEPVSRNWNKFKFRAQDLIRDSLNGFPTNLPISVEKAASFSSYHLNITLPEGSHLARGSLVHTTAHGDALLPTKEQPYELEIIPKETKLNDKRIVSSGFASQKPHFYIADRKHGKLQARPRKVHCRPQTLFLRVPEDPTRTTLRAMIASWLVFIGILVSADAQALRYANESTLLDAASTASQYAVDTVTRAADYSVILGLSAMLFAIIAFVYRPPEKNQPHSVSTAAITSLTFSILLQIATILGVSGALHFSEPLSLLVDEYLTLQWIGEGALKINSTLWIILIFTSFAACAVMTHCFYWRWVRYVDLRKYNHPLGTAG